MDLSDARGRLWRFGRRDKSACCATCHAAAWIAMAVALVGCEQSPYELAPVHGTVTVDGEPLSGRRVMFAPISSGDGNDAGKPAFGTLQTDGSYVLTTYRDGDGAVVGEHWVTVFGSQEGAEPVGSWSLPKFRRYVVREKQLVVGSQSNQIDLQLTSQEITRFARQ